MVDIEKLNSAKVWIDKLANGINPLTDELVKDDDLINNVHISRCLFYVTELLEKIKTSTLIERTNKKTFFISKENAANIQISSPNGIAQFVRSVNGYVPADMKPLSPVQVIKWLRNEGVMQEVQKEDGHKTNLPTEEGVRMGITTETVKNQEGKEYVRVVYSVEAQRFILNNIESIAKNITSDRFH